VDEAAAIADFLNLDWTTDDREELLGYHNNNNNNKGIF